jgi:hypothetical protein
MATINEGLLKYLTPLDDFNNSNIIPGITQIK